MYIQKSFFLFFYLAGFSPRNWNKMAKPRKVLLQLTMSFEMYHPYFEDIVLHHKQ